MLNKINSAYFASFAVNSSGSECLVAALPRWVSVVNSTSQETQKNRRYKLTSSGSSDGRAISAGKGSGATTAPSGQREQVTFS